MLTAALVVLGLWLFWRWFRWDNARHEARMDRIYAEHFPGFDRHATHKEV